MAHHIRRRGGAWAPVAALLLLAGSADAVNPPSITQQGIAFNPRAVTIKVGQQVLFRNEDPFGHNVYSPNMESIFDIGLQEPGTETPVTFSTAGEITIQCRIHPKMRAKVTVVP